MLNLLTLAVNFPLTIFVALMLNEVIHLRFKKMIQSILYLPHFISWVVVAGIAANMFTQRDGTINLVLNSLGISSIPFLSDEKWWIVTYVICSVWKEIGWGTIIYLAALTGVDESLYEAAYLDGCNTFQKFWRITVPMLKNTLVYVLISTTINTLKLFTQVYVLTNGGPQNATTSVVYLLYKSGFINQQVGYSSAIAVVFFIIVFVISEIQNYIIGKE